MPGFDLDNVCFIPAQWTIILLVYIIIFQGYVGKKNWKIFMHFKIKYDKK